MLALICAGTVKLSESLTSISSSMQCEHYSTSTRRWIWWQSLGRMFYVSCRHPGCICHRKVLLLYILYCKYQCVRQDWLQGTAATSNMENALFRSCSCQLFTHKDINFVMLIGVPLIECQKESPGMLYHTYTTVL